MWVLIFYQLSRVVFYFSNRQVFSSAGIREFFGGIRFDLSALFYVNALFILMHTVPGKFKYRKGYQKILKISFFLVNLIFLATNFIDAEYYKFISRRSTFALITVSGMEADILRLIPVFAKDYWYMLLLFAVTAILFWKGLSGLKAGISEEKETDSILEKSAPYLLFLVSAGLIILTGRGGFQRNPLKIVDAIHYTDNSVNTPLVLNTPFSILKTMSKNNNLKEVSYFSEKELNKQFAPVIHLKNEGEFVKKNIVLLILESFGEENLFLESEGRKLTPFLDSLSQNSLYFTNAYANGRKSIDAVPSTILSIPCLMEVSYISSPYSFNKVDGFNNILKEKGYHTAFFHGSFNGSQNFQQFSTLASFDEYFGKDEYDRPGGEDGVWGIFDEEFLQFANRRISTFKEPFFVSVFTISSHVPYTIPEKYKGKFPKGNRMIHESVAYADYALREFFRSARKEEWYKNSIFLITPDHTSGDDKTDAYYTSATGNYKIPLMIIDPAAPGINRKEPKLVEQIDLLPEALNYLNYSGEIFSFGNDPLKASGRMVANFNEGIYHFIIDNYYVCFNGTSIIKVCDIEKDKLLRHNLESYPKKDFENRIKAYIQQYNNRIIKNQTSLSSY